MSTRTVMTAVTFHVGLEVAEETTDNEIHEIINDMNYEFHYGDNVGASKEEVMDIEIIQG